MTATITLADRRLPLPIADEALLHRIVTAVASQTDEEFRVRRPSPDGRQRATVFRAVDVTGIEAYHACLGDYASPVGYAAETLEVAA